ncbi:MAG TPA: SURF1 family protein [Microlunatus sp.]|nr:SURF1 family protein [Microlunatus sp.]
MTSTMAADSPSRPRALLGLQRAGILLLGLVLGVGMVVLGIWQAEVYQSQGVEAAQQRAAEPPRPLTEVAPVGGSVVDGYGRTVTLSGRYRPELQLLLPGEDGVRVLTALEQPDGSLVAVVRGVVADVAARPSAPPAGTVRQSGLFLPSDDSEGPEAVRVQRLAQDWPGRLVNGYVTLAPADAEAQRIAPAPYRLPEASGRLRNGAYAVQWWVFAAFAVGMSIKMARDLGRPRDEADGSTT